MNEPETLRTAMRTALAAAEREGATETARLLREGLRTPRDTPAPACEGKPWVHTYTHGERGE